MENRTISTPEMAAGMYFQPSEIHSVGSRYSQTESASSAQFQAMAAPKTRISAWIRYSIFSRSQSGASTRKDSRPIWPASRTPTATPSMVT